MNRRQFLSAAFIAFSTSTLAACAPTAPSAPAAPESQASTAAPQPVAQATTPAAQAGESPVELRLHVRTGQEVDTLTELLPPFEEEHALKVKVEDFPQND